MTNREKARSRKRGYLEGSAYTGPTILGDLCILALIMFIVFLLLVIE